MILGTGIDIVKMIRINDTIERFGDRFIKRVFTEGEAAYCERKRISHQHYATRFAAKEAFLKALGTGLSKGIGWKDVEVVREKGKRPTIAVHGKAREIFIEKKVKNVFLSLTHEGDYGVAEVILEG